MTRSASATRADVVGRLDPAERRVAVLRREPALGDGPIEVAGDPVAARLGAGELRLVQRHRLADRGVDLGDAVAHQPGARDEDPFDRGGHGNGW